MPDHVMVLAGDFAYAVFAWMLIFVIVTVWGMVLRFYLFIYLYFIE